MPGSPKLSLSIRFTNQTPVYASPRPHTRYMSRPFHSRFYHPNNIGWRVQIIKLANNNNNNNNNNTLLVKIFVFHYCMLKLIYILCSECSRQSWKANIFVNEVQLLSDPWENFSAKCRLNDTNWSVHCDILYCGHNVELSQEAETSVWCTLNSNKRRKRRTNNLPMQ
jgi:hypothetical protein